VTPVSGFNTIYTVTANATGMTGTNAGSIRLDLSSIGTIQDGATSAADWMGMARPWPTTQDRPCRRGVSAPLTW